MVIRVKRIYEPIQKTDGLRILVDRLWPRGITKETAKIDLWLKLLTPSAKLRQWFHQNRTDRFTEFEKLYLKELTKNKTDIKNSLPKSDTITLITAVKDINHSHIPTLVNFLSQLYF